MSNRRRSTFRLSRGVSRDKNPSISQFVQRKSRDVEVVDDDDVQDLTDQFSFNEEEVQPVMSRRRRNRPIILDEESDDESGKEDSAAKLDGCENLDEDERQQFMEAVRLSRQEMKLEAERRAKSEKSKYLNFNKETETVPSSIASCSYNTTEEPQENTPSSPTSSGLERQERAASPELFATPRSNDDNEFDDDIDVSQSPTSGQPTSVSSTTLEKSHKEILIQLTPVKRQSISIGSSNDDQKNRLKLKKMTEPKETAGEDGSKAWSHVGLKKRKHCIEEDDDDDFTDDETTNDKEIKSVPHPTDSRKKLKTTKYFSDDDTTNDLEISIPHPTDSSKNQATTTIRSTNAPWNYFTKNKCIKPEKTPVIINDDNDEQKDDEKMTKRTSSTSKGKKAVKFSLERTYKKPKLSIKSIKDAVKARLYFAPPGIEPNTYTFAIIKMLDHTRKRILRAQQKSLNFLQWGNPVVVGPRKTDTLDALPERKKPRVALESTMMLASASGSLMGDRKGSLRSARARPEPDTKEINREKKSMESDDSDDDLTKSVFGGQNRNNSMHFTENIFKTESLAKFGENIVTSSMLDRDEFDNDRSRPQNDGNSLREAQAVSSTSNSKEYAQAGIHDDVCAKKPKRNVNEMHENERDKLESIPSINDSPKKSGASKSDRNIHQTGPQKGDVKDNTYVSGDDIDSSVETGMNKSKLNLKKTPVIEDDEDSDIPLFGIEMAGLEENTKDNQDNMTEPNQDVKPGSTLTDLGFKSGFLKANRTLIPEVQRKVSSASKKAAKAALRRMKSSSDVESSSEITINVEPSQDIVSSAESLVECPMCFSRFPKHDVEAHASSCNGTPPEISKEPVSSREEIHSNQRRGFPTEDQEQNTRKHDLKDLRVLLSRSPEAQRKLAERNTASAKTKLNLRLNKNDERHRSDDGSAGGRARRYIDMTIGDTPGDDGPSRRQKTSEQSQHQGESQGDAPTSLWPSSSHVDRHKEKFKVTYGEKKKSLGSRVNPFKPLDFTPLEETSSIDDSNDDDGITEHPKRKNKLDNIEYSSDGRSDGVEEDTTATSRNAEYGDLDSDTNSDVELFSSYEVKGESETKKGSVPSTKSINEVLAPRRQKPSRTTTKRRADEDFDHDDYENEMALMELSGMPLKRCKVDSKAKADRFPTKRRRKTISSDDSDDNYESCFICSERVAKEDFGEHTEACLQGRGASVATPGKVTRRSTKSETTRRRRSPRKEAKSSTQTVERDSDEIGDSPVKTFKLIGEESESTVDFSNQFAFFGKGKSSRGANARGRGGGGWKSQRGKFTGKRRYRKGRRR